MRHHSGHLIAFTAALGLLCAFPAHAQLPPGPATITINGTQIINGTNGLCLYDNNGKVGEQACGSSSAITALTGDVTATGPGSVPATLASIISAGGPTGSATVAPIITYDAKGRLTAVSSATITPAISNITGLGTNCATWLATPSSANLAACLTDETGTGLVPFSDSPTFTTLVTVSNGRLLMNGSQTVAAGPAGILQIDTTITNNANSIAAIRVAPTLNGSGNVAQGMIVNPLVQPSTSIGVARGLQLQVSAAPGAGITITDVFGIYATGVTGSAGGTITNHTIFIVDSPIYGTTKPTTAYGLRINNQGSASITTSYAQFIAVQSGSTNNYALWYDAASPTIIQASGCVSVGVNTDCGAGALLTNAGVRASTTLQVGSATAFTLATGELGGAKISASGTAPGAGSAKMAWVAGTNAGSCKLISYAGTSTTPVTIVDNVGSGC